MGGEDVGRLFYLANGYISVGMPRDEWRSGQGQYRWSKASERERAPGRKLLYCTITYNPYIGKNGVPSRLRAGAVGKTYSAEAVAAKATAW